MPFATLISTEIFHQSECSVRLFIPFNSTFNRGVKEIKIVLVIIVENISKPF